jgi:nucleoside-diphosphate-sugar epimerase
MDTVLVTGGSGFFGQILIARLLERGHACVNVDLVPSELVAPDLVSVQGDIRQRKVLIALLEAHRVSAIYHCAAILAHGRNDRHMLWESNVDGTRNVAESARAHGVRKVVFISSNCLWGRGFEQAVTEEEPPAPVELYGRSKLEGERILLGMGRELDVSILRCPTIMDSGRLGLLTILFEFIDEGRRVWLVGDGSNRYQFVFAGDLAEACMRAARHDRSEVFNVGSDRVKSFADVYQYVIERAQTGARIGRLPDGLTRLAMRAAYRLGLSPLGPYQYRMISANFVFDTSKIKAELGWAPTLTNEEMLHRSYEYYHAHRREIAARSNVSAHRSAAKMGVIRVLKWVS